MRVLYYDCFSGISGDMNLAALLDLGVDATYLQTELSKLGCDDEFHLEITPSHKKGIHGTSVHVVLSHNPKQTTQWHVHPHHHEHTHRTFKDIEGMIQKSSLSDFVKQTSLKIFWEVALAEGRVHGKDPYTVGFHEVGATDSIVDIVGAAICLEALRVDKIMASTIELGGGFATCAHGTIPIPAPATMEILKHVPVSLGRVSHETTTPTGAAIIKATVNEFVKTPHFHIQRIGYGIGHKDFSIPNVLRVFLVEEASEATQEIVLETNIDDMSPEILAFVQEKLFSIGVKDVYTTAITTKKNRLGVKLSILTTTDKENDVMQIVFEETSSIGLRRFAVDKIALDRTLTCVQTPYGDIDVKCSFYHGKRVKYKAEFDQCKHAALKHNIPISKIYEYITKYMSE